MLACEQGMKSIKPHMFDLKMSYLTALNCLTFSFGLYCTQNYSIAMSSLQGAHLPCCCQQNGCKLCHLPLPGFCLAYLFHICRISSSLSSQLSSIIILIIIRLCELFCKMRDAMKEFPGQKLDRFLHIFQLLIGIF